MAKQLDDQDKCIIEKIEELPKAPCVDCGRYDWNMAMATDIVFGVPVSQPAFMMCDLCHYWDYNEKRLKVKPEIIQ